MTREQAEMQRAVREAAVEVLVMEFEIVEAGVRLVGTKEVKGVIKRMGEVIKERYRGSKPHSDTQSTSTFKQEDLDLMK